MSAETVQERLPAENVLPGKLTIRHWGWCWLTPPVSVLRHVALRKPRHPARGPVQGARPARSDGPPGGGQRAQDGRRLLLQHLRRQEGPDGGRRHPGRENPVDGGHQWDCTGEGLAVKQMWTPIICINIDWFARGHHSQAEPPVNICCRGENPVKYWHHLIKQNNLGIHFQFFSSPESEELKLRQINIWA